MFSSVSVTHYLTAPKVRSVLSGVCFKIEEYSEGSGKYSTRIKWDDYALAVDDFDTSDKSDTPIIEIDPQGLVPTQDDVEEDHVIRLAKVPSVELPPVKVVAVLGQLRILDGHHRACAAAVAGRKVRAWVLRLDA